MVSKLRKQPFRKIILILLIGFFIWTFLINDMISKYKRKISDIQKNSTGEYNLYQDTETSMDFMNSYTTIETTTTILPTVSTKKKFFQKKINLIRRERIKNMTRHGWENYKRYAWGKNELKPISKRENNQGIFGNSGKMGATIVDSLDTLYLMNMTDEFNEATNWLIHNFNINVNTEMSVFEVNIRIVGGFLSAFTLTNNKFFLEKAVEVANLILPVFDTPTGIPITYFNPNKTDLIKLKLDSGSCVILSEIGTLSLEFSYISELTGNPIYEEKVNKIYEALDQTIKIHGLYFDFINPSTGEWCSKHASMGALSDSFYEYLFKLWLYKAKKDSILLQTYINAIEAIKKYLIKKSKNGLSFTGEYTLYQPFMPKMEHLACFSGGLFALTSISTQGYLSSKQRKEFKELAIEITNTCHESYVTTATKLGPESFSFEFDELTPIDTNYLLRPEVVESYFYLWKITRDEKYREWAWQVAIAIDTYCRTDGGYSGIRDVNEKNQINFDDVQQSFFFAETLKYLYLIFSDDDDLIPLDKYVFNTEAHPFRIRNSI